MSFVALGIQYFVNPYNGKPVYNGYIYIGEPDTDPTIEANQKAITLKQENGVEVATTQPVRTGAGGVPMYNNSPVQIIVDGNYSLLVQDSYQQQVYFVPSGASLSTLGSITVRRQLYTAVGGETVINMINGFAYTPGQNDLNVYIDGVFQYLESGAYAETSTTSITVSEALVEGQEVLMVTNDIGNTSLVGTSYPQLGAAVLWEGLPWVDVRMSGAVGDGSTDDALAIQTAIDNANEGDSVFFPNGTWIIKSGIIVDKLLHFIGPGTIKMPADFVPTSDQAFAFSVSADGCTFTGLKFLSEFAGADEDDAFLWVTAGKTVVTRCDFEGLDAGGVGGYFAGAIAFVSGGSGGNRVTNCSFTDCPGGAFTQQPNDIFMNNVATNPKDASFVVNSPAALNCIVSGNVVNADGLTAFASSIAIEQGPSYCLVSDNVIYGLNGGYGIGVVDIGGFTTVGYGNVVCDNIINGNAGASSVGIVVDPYYENTQVFGNTIQNCETSGMNVYFVATHIHHNTILGTPTYGIYVRGADFGKTLRIEDNFIDCGTYGIIFASITDYATSTVLIKRNTFNSGVLGIDANTNVLNINEMVLEDNIATGVTTYQTVLKAISGTYIRDKLNAYNTNRPHYVSNARKEFWADYATLTPTSGSYVAGDYIRAVDPVAAGYSEMVYTNLGAWKGRNLVQA